MAQRGPQIPVNTCDRPIAVAVRQVFIKELPHYFLIYPINWQDGLRDPVRKVRNTIEVTPGRVGRVAALAQLCTIGINMWRKRAIAQPSLGRGVK